MKKIRSRLTILLCLLTLFTCLLSLVFSMLIRNGIILQRDVMRFSLFGYSVRDILLLILALAAMAVLITLTSRSTTNPIRDLSQAAQEIAAGNFDVTVDIRDNVEELGELEKNFNLMVSELRANEYLRKDFITNVSHELKTPLAILSGYSRLLSEGGLTEAERQEYARYVAEESDRLVSLIDNMLRLSRIDHQHIQPKRELFDLAEQLRQAILRWEPRWSAAGLEIAAALPEEAPYTGDAELLFQAWSNLLDNAIKFSRPGGAVSVTLEEQPDSLCITVSDNGPGMAPATLERIFEQFYQGETDHRREGSGLGLPLVRRIAELHGGSVSAESEVGQGSRFTVILPRS